MFVYAGLASAGGTVPVEALPGFLRTLSYVEPLRQVIEGTRSILYFNAQGVAGLTRGTVAAAAGLVFWLVVGGFVVRWYDRRASTASGPRSSRTSTSRSRTSRRPSRPSRPAGRPGRRPGSQPADAEPRPGRPPAARPTGWKHDLTRRVPI